MKKFRKKLVSVALSTGITLGGVSTCNFLTKTNCKAITLDEVKRLVYELQIQPFYKDFQTQIKEYKAREYDKKSCITHSPRKNHIVGIDNLGLHEKATELYKQASTLCECEDIVKLYPTIGDMNDKIKKLNDYIVELNKQISVEQEQQNKEENERIKFWFEKEKELENLDGEKANQLKNEQVTRNSEMYEKNVLPHIKNISHLQRDIDILRTKKIYNLKKARNLRMEADNLLSFSRNGIEEKLLRKKEIINSQISEFEKQIYMIEKDATDLTNRAKNLREILSKQSNIVGNINNEINTLDNEINNLTKDSDKLDAQANQCLKDPSIENLMQVIKSCEESAQLKLKIETLKNQKNELRKHRTKLENEIYELRKQIDEIDKDVSKKHQETLPLKNKKNKLFVEAQILQKEADSHVLQKDSIYVRYSNKHMSVYNEDMGSLFLNENYQLNHEMLENSIKLRNFRNNISNNISVEELTILLFEDMRRFLETTDLISSDDDRNMILGCFRTHSFDGLIENINGLGEEWTPLKQLICNTIGNDGLDDFIINLKACHKNYIDMIKYSSEENKKQSTRNIQIKTLQLIESFTNANLNSPDIEEEIIYEFGVDTYDVLRRCTSPNEQLYDLMCYYHIVNGGIGNSDVWARYFSKVLSNNCIENYILHISDGWHSNTHMKIVAYKLNDQWYGFTLYNTPEQIQNRPGVAKLSTCLENISKLYISEIYRRGKMIVMLDETKDNHFEITYEMKTNTTWVDITDRLIRQLYNPPQAH